MARKPGATIRCDEVPCSVPGLTPCHVPRIKPLPSGYVQLCRVRNGKKVGILAHRLIFEDLNGPIFPDMEIDHLCFNPACCNPDHLEQVSQQENHRRAKEHRRRFPTSRNRSPKTHCRRGHPYDSSNTFFYGPNRRYYKCRLCDALRNRAARTSKSKQPSVAT